MFVGFFLIHFFFVHCVLLAELTKKKKFISYFLLRQREREREIKGQNEKSLVFFSTIDSNILGGHNEDEQKEVAGEFIKVWW